MLRMATPFFSSLNIRTRVQTPAGCVAVALSQYMYFTHFKDGVPVSSVTTATPTSDGRGSLGIPRMKMILGTIMDWMRMVML